MNRTGGGRFTRACGCLAAAVAALLLAAQAHAAAGVNLRWTRCFGDGGVQFRQFACNTNSGNDRMVGSFELAEPVARAFQLRIDLHVGVAAARLPAWWLLAAPGYCRLGAANLIATPFAPAGSAVCADWARGAGLGSAVAITPESQGPNHLRLQLEFAVMTPVDLAAGQEYFAFTLGLGHQASVGTDACPGCLEPAVIALSGIEVRSATASPVLLDHGANGVGSRWVSWQFGYPVNLHQRCLDDCGGTCCTTPITLFDVVPYDVTPAQRTSWSAVKALYR